MLVKTELMADCETRLLILRKKLSERENSILDLTNKVNVARWIMQDILQTMSSPDYHSMTEHVCDMRDFIKGIIPSQYESRNSYDLAPSSSETKE